MKTQPLGCMSSMMLKEIDHLCPGLEQLKKEHVPLTRQMENFYELTQLMDQNETEATHGKLQQLYKQVQQFVSELEPHSEREEGILFEMVAAYIGRENGPIVVMEYEHDQAKNHLRQFLLVANQVGPTTDIAKIRAIADHAAKAYLILSEHFMKEENILFPLAEQFLSPEEKLDLEVKIKSIS